MEGPPRAMPATPKKAFGTAIQDQAIIPLDTMHPHVNGKQVEAWGGIAIKSSG